MKITIETEQPSEITALIESLKNTIHTGCDHLQHNADCGYRRAQKLAESAKHFMKSIDNATAEKVLESVKKDEWENTKTNSEISRNIPEDAVFWHVKAELKDPTAAESIIQVDDSAKLPKEAKAKIKKMAKKAAASKKTTPGPQKGVCPACVDAWTEDEICLLRTCKSADDAKFVYHSHYGVKRGDHAIEQKWYKTMKAGQVLKVGDTVRCIDGSYDGAHCTITGFTDNRTQANVKFPKDSAMYQFMVSNLERVD